MSAALLVAAGVAAGTVSVARGGDAPVGGWKPTPPQKVADGSSPRVSPGGKRLAFYRHQLDLKTRDADGQPQTVAILHVKDLATGTETVAARNGRVAAWSGDDLLVFEDGTSLRLAGECGEPAFPALPDDYAPASGRSRDGTTLAWVGRGDFAKPREIGEAMPHEAVHVLATGKPVQNFAVGDGPNMDGSRGFLAISPDGRRLAMHLEFMHYGQPPHPRVAVLDLAGGASVFVLDEPYGSQGAEDAGTWQSGVAAEGVWDGRGTRFVFVRTIGGTKRDLFTAAADGTDLRRVTTDARWKASPCLSPEGDRCACWADAGAPSTKRRSHAPSGSEGEPKHLLSLYQLRTGERIDLPLPATGTGADLHWSGDGTSLWFEWTAEDGSAIWRVEAPPPAPVAAGTPLVDRTSSPLDEMLESLASEDDNEVEQAIERAGEFDDAKVTDALRDVMRRWARNDYRPYPCVAALRARGAVSAIPEFMEELARGEWLDAVSPPLIEWRVTAAIPLWRRVFASGPPGGRATAAVALARMGEKDGWDLVREAVKVSDAHALGRLCTALEQARDPRSVDILIPLLSDQDDIYAGLTVRQAAARALQRLTGESLGLDPDVWAKWWDSVGKRLPDAAVASEGEK
jgi:hypothetical protein